MALFKPLPQSKARRGHLQEVYCPRCRELLPGSEESTTITGEGVGRRKVTGTFHCSCGYEVTFIETYPVINVAER